MELQAAREIIDTLAQGIHPVTGEPMPDDSPYNAPVVIRALFTVSRALDAGRRMRSGAELPPNAGKPWSPQEDAQLETAFTAGAKLEQMAKDLGRTRYAVESRLVKLGKLPPGRGSVPFGTGAAA